jgi:hypothetical protein
VRVVAVAIAIGCGATARPIPPSPPDASPLAASPLGPYAAACAPDETCADTWSSHDAAIVVAPVFREARLVQVSRGGMTDGTTVCGIALRGDAVWFYRELVMCGWTTMGSTPRVEVRFDGAVRGGSTLLVRFTKHVQVPGERDDSGDRGFTEHETTFVVACSAGGAPCCSAAIPIGGLGWNRSVDLDDRGTLAFGAPSEKPAEPPLAADGQYDATSDEPQLPAGRYRLACAGDG